jgi:hypothetical protein
MDWDEAPVPAALDEVMGPEQAAAAAPLELQLPAEYADAQPAAQPVEPAAQPVEPVEPAAQPVEPAAQPVEPAAPVQIQPAAPPILFQGLMAAAAGARPLTQSHYRRGQKLPHPDGEGHTCAGLVPPHPLARACAAVVSPQWRHRHAPFVPAQAVPGVPDRLCVSCFGYEQRYLRAQAAQAQPAQAAEVQPAQPEAQPLPEPVA